MKFILMMALFLTLSHTASFAVEVTVENPFPGIDTKTYRFGSDICPAASIFSNAVERAGVNPLTRGGISKVWKCDEIKSGLDKASDHPFNDVTLGNACSAGKSVVCYANGSQSELCIIGAAVDKVTRRYATGVFTEIRPRFSKLIARTRDASDFVRSTTWTMDEKGCNVVAASGHTPDVFDGSSGSGPIYLDACKAEMQKYMNGQNFYRSEIDSTKHYGDGASRDVHWDRIDTLAGCKLAYPELLKNL